MKGALQRQRSVTGTRAGATLAAILAFAALAAAPAAARAEGSISITGTTTVTRGLRGSFHITGAAAGPDQYGVAENEVQVRVVPASTPCGTTGTQSAVDSNLGFDSTLQGPASFDFPWEPPVENYIEVGSYAACASLFRDFEYLTGARMTFTVVQPEFQMKESVPRHMRVGQKARFAVYGQLQAAAYLETQILPSRILICGAASCHYRTIHACAPTPQAEERLTQESESVSYPFYGDGEPRREVAAGSFRFSRRLLAKSAGVFRMCSWLTEQGENEDPARLFVSARWRVY